MNNRSYITFIILLFGFVHLLAQLLFKEQIILLLDTNLPFRESYSPSILGIAYIYILPIILGFLLSGFFSSKTYKFIYNINLALLVGLINFIPFFYVIPGETNWFINLVIIYYFILFPILFFVGSAPYYFNEFNLIEKNKKDNKNLSLYDYITALTFALLIFVLNIIPRSLSSYLVGADVYYHAAMTQKIAESLDITRSPFFFEDKNYYFSIGYFIITYAHKFTGIDFVSLWMIFIPLISSIFILLFYTLTKKLSGSTLTSTIATILLFPFNQILWYDPSLRIISYGFFLTFLYTLHSYITKHHILSLIASILFLLLTAATHPEIAVHSLIIVIVYFVLVNKPFLLKIMQKGVQIIFNARLNYVSGIDIKGLGSVKSFLALLSLYLLILASKNIFLLQNFPINKILAFNEIPLSVLQPVGAISFITFLFAPVGIYQTITKPTKNNMLLISIYFLFLTSIFYFTHVWILYHRYFAETAYFALAILSAKAITSMLNCFTLKQKTFFFIILLGFLLLSIIPKYNFITSYSISTNAIILDKLDTINLIKMNTVPNSVIIVNPDNMLNRYIPFYTNRYIFAGSSEISKNHQWQVLSFCNGPFSNTCNKRLELSDNFFTNPSLSTFNKIKYNFKVDYLLLSAEEIARFTKSDLDLSKKIIKENNYYSLYDLRSIR